MKKKAFVLLVTVLLVLTSCGKGVTSEKKEETDEKTEAVSTQKEPAGYRNLSTAKGLEVYVWQMSEESYRFGLMEGTNREKTLEEIMELKGVSAAEMKSILATYTIPKENIFIIPIQHPISSYIGDYWVVPEGETEDSVTLRRQEYVDHIREMILEKD